MITPRCEQSIKMYLIIDEYQEIMIVFRLLEGAQSSAENEDCNRKRKNRTVS